MIKKRGSCQVCEREYTLTLLGQIRKHRTDVAKWRGEQWISEWELCPGSNHVPKTEERK